MARVTPRVESFWEKAARWYPDGDVALHYRRHPDHPVFVYGLTDPQEPEEVRYVGLTDNPQVRLVNHIAETRRPVDYPRVAWLRELVAAGRQPVVTILEEVTEATSLLAERRWIRHYAPLGRLTNCQGNARYKRMGNKGRWVPREAAQAAP